MVMPGEDYFAHSVLVKAALSACGLPRKTLTVMHDISENTWIPVRIGLTQNVTSKGNQNHE